MSDFRQMRIGAPLPIALNSGSFSSFGISASNSQMEWIVQVPCDNAGDSITINQLGYRLSGTTGTSPVYKISIQGVDGTGIPDGTIKGGASPASKTFTPSGSNTWNWVTLDNAYVAVRGEVLAIVIAYDSGTINGSNLATFTHSLASPAVDTFPYAIQNNAGVRARQTLYPVLGYSTASKAYGFPVQGTTSTPFSSDSTPDEYGMHFVIDAAFVSTYKVAGVRFQIQTPAASKTYVVNLYDGTTVIQTKTMDGDHCVAAASLRCITVYFDNSVSLQALVGGSAYRIGLQAQETSANLALGYLSFAAASDLDALPGGQQFYRSTRTDAGAWTDTTTFRPIMELIIQDWTAASGSGLMLNPSLEGL